MEDKNANQKLAHEVLLQGILNLNSKHNYKNSSCLKAVQWIPQFLQHGYKNESKDGRKYPRWSNLQRMAFVQG